MTFLFPSRNILMLTVGIIAVVVLSMNSATAQRRGLGGIQNTLGPVPQENEPDIQQRLDAIEALLRRVAPKIIFVTSETFDGNLGGLAGADAICQRLADAANVFGSYKAWLSDSTVSPANRFSMSSAPYIRVDGIRVADSFSDLIDGNLTNPINVDETSAKPVDDRVWTGTQIDGTTDGREQHCGNWQSTTGDGSFGVSSDTNRNWTDTLAADACSISDKRLYCMEQ